MGGGDSEVWVSGPPTETRCQGLSFPSKARPREFFGLQSVCPDSLPEFRWEGCIGNQSLSFLAAGSATLGGPCYSSVVGKGIHEGKGI